MNPDEFSKEIPKFKFTPSDQHHSEWSNIIISKLLINENNYILNYVPYTIEIISLG